jgi:hypothetical protein
MHALPVLEEGKRKKSRGQPMSDENENVPAEMGQVNKVKLFVLCSFENSIYQLLSNYIEAVPIMGT